MKMNMPVIDDTYWNGFFAVIVTFSILALIIERALYQIFDTKFWKKLEGSLGKERPSEFIDLKPWISALVCIVIVFQLKLDLVAMMFDKDQQFISQVITGLFLAGGSTGIYKFFKRARKLKDNMTLIAPTNTSAGNTD